MKKSIFFLKITITALIFLTILGSCSTKKNRWTNRTYHNINSQFNAWFNGNESLKEGVGLQLDKHKDNYLKVLQVYPIVKKEDATSTSPQTDRAIEKATKVIKKHSMYIKGVEYCKWIDDSYLMMGKAFYYKQDYENAQKTFNYIINSYKNGDKLDEAKIWFARSCVKLKEFTRAETVMDELRLKIDKLKKNKSLKRYFNMAYADMLIEQEQYLPAVEYVQEAIVLKPKRKEKTRLMYILAQLYQANGNLNSAYDEYAKVIRRSPNYEMSFNAKISMAKCYEGNSVERKEYLIKQLTKMLDDRKNIEYSDQIYYTLAEIALKDENETEAIEYLKKSIETSINNNYQKSASALKLGNLYFYQKNYTPSQQYYDTAITFLPKDYPDYKNIKARTEILTNLVQNLIIIKTQDSLQQLAKLPENERMKIIDQIIEDYIIAEQKRQQEEAERKQLLESLTENQTNTQEGGWYFYNTATLKFGYADFEKKWGKRKLEDNWRRSVKDLVLFEEKPDEDEEADSNKTKENTTQKPFNPRDRNSYLKDIPLTPELIAKSNDKIANALFNVGFIYKEDLNENQQSCNAFDTLYNRYPQFKKILPALYQNYQNYLQANNLKRAEEIKQIIIKNYPNSYYAEILKDPNYLLIISEKEKEGEKFYTNAFLNYSNKEYDSVVVKNKIAHQNYPKNKKLLAKFDYIKAISIGILFGNDSLKNELNYIIKTYPDTEIKELAQYILDNIANYNKAVNNNDSVVFKNVAVEEKFIVNNSDKHYYILIADSKKVNFNDLKIKISDLNLQFFGLLGLQISDMYIDDRNQMITVKSFENKQKGMDYFNFIRSKKDAFGNMEQSILNQFIISDKNYITYYKNKNLREEYIKFFDNNYIKE